MSGLGNIFVLHQLRVLGIDDVLLVALDVALIIVGGGGVIKFSLAPLSLERPAIVLQASYHTNSNMKLTPPLNRAQVQKKCLTPISMALFMSDQPNLEYVKMKMIP